MLFPTKETNRLRAQISRDLTAGKLDDGAAAERLDELCGDTLVCLVKGQEQESAGDLDGAECWYWKGIGRAPQTFTFYLKTADVRRKRDAADLLAPGLFELALWKLAAAESIPDWVAEHFRSNAADPRLDYSDPETYAMLATMAQVWRTENEEPAEATARLLPCRLLDALQRDAPSAVEQDLLEGIQENAAQVAPLLRAALQDWARYPESLDSRAVAMFAAVLGEIGTAEILPDFLELAANPDYDIFLHANWAIWRLGQRFPAETIAVFRDAAPKAPLPIRCAIADHLSLLPDGVDIEPVAQALLEDFKSFGKEDDAAYLLISVMVARKVEEEKTVAEYLRRYGRWLSKKGRDWLFETSADEDGFVPKLAALGMSELDIEDVCLGRELMEDDEDEEDDEDFEDDEDEDHEEEEEGDEDADEDDEDEDDEEEDWDEDEEDLDDDEEYVPETVIAAPKPGRNDPCWCGSGKKYKKCHLDSDEQEARLEEPADSRRPQREESRPPYDNRMHKKLSAGILAGAERWYPKSEWRKGMQVYFGDELPAADDDETMDLFLQWFLHDYRSRTTGRTALAEYLRVEGPRLNAAERDMAESMCAARYGLYEVQRVEEGRGVELTDVFRGDRMFVEDITSSKELVMWDCILSRVEFLEGRYSFAANGESVPRVCLEPLKHFIEHESRMEGRTPVEFLSTNAHRIHRRLVELRRERVENFQLSNGLGEPIEFSSAEYRILGDRAAVFAALRGRADLHENSRPDDAEHRFGWTATVVEGPAPSYGDIAIAEDRLKLECTTRQRLEAGREMLENTLGILVRHQIDRFETVDEARQRTKKERRGKPSKGASPGIDPEVQAAIVGKMKRDHYARWVDEALPALSGSTPRQAMSTEDGRRRVRDLVRGIENLEAHARKQGKPYFDTEELRQTLGLTEG
jgi:SEC-C motif/Protein of unknown function (DUF2384)